MSIVNADLHCHSRFSDGTLSPAELAARARGHGVDLWALTDHDGVDGVAAAAAAARDAGLDFLTGVEVSVSFAGETVHIVGLGFDVDDAALREGLARTRGGRRERALEMAADLAAAGIPGGFEGALPYVGNPELISRTHFARWLVETGVCTDTAEVFRRFLVEGKPGFVPHRWATLGDAVRWISDAGGIAVIAHPGRYGRLSPSAEYALFSEFVTHGGRGVEVMCGSRATADAVKYAEMAREFDLLASRGCDFHAPGESRAEFGSLPALPAALTPVWKALEDRIQRP